jgi:two-component system sensor histidine kinase FlrB
MALAFFSNNQTIQKEKLNGSVLSKQAVETSLFAAEKSIPEANTIKSQSYLQQMLLENQALKQQLKQSQAQNQYFNQLIDVMPTGVVMLDGNGIVVKVNAIAHELLDEPILGQAWFDVIKRSFKPREDDWHEVSLKNGRRVKLAIQAINNQPGQLITITDLTETRLLQDKISHMQRLSSLGKMVSSLAHQIRTPLSSAILYGANLANKKLTEQAKAGFQHKLMTRLQALEQQVNDMLLFAKSGEQQIVEPLSINELITDSVKSMDALIEEKQGKVNISFATPNNAEQSTQVLGNKTALTGAIQNLIDNSLQLIQHVPVIDISVFYQTDSVFISVKDNGPGIEQSIADKIFDPFVTSRVQGTGLGLAVVKSVAQAHKGNVQLLSKSGEGAHFCVQLPLIVTAEQQSHQESTHE